MTSLPLEDQSIKESAGQEDGREESGVESRAEQRWARRGVGSKKEATTRKIVNMLQHQEGERGRRESERETDR